MGTQYKKMHSIKFITMLEGINEAYYSDHFTIDINIKSLCYTPDTNIMIYVHYASVRKIQMVTSTILKGGIKG